MITDTMPSEFVGFVREAGVRAFDRLSGRARELQPPLASFVRSWGRLSDADKQALFDALIVAATSAEENEALNATPKATKPVRRFTPEEVAATLPENPVVRRDEASSASDSITATE